MKQYNDMHFQIQKNHKNECDVCLDNLQLGVQMDSEDLGAILERIDERENIKGPIS
jgi:hypothetical protein